MTIKLFYLLTNSSDMLNKYTWSIKTVQGQEEPATKSFDIK